MISHGDDFALDRTGRAAGRRVLIVDDLASNRLVLQMFLEQQGYAADFACDGAEAVSKAGQNRYDAILMDLQMPVVDGYTATERIRATETNHTIIVAVTAAQESGTREKCLAVGMDGHFTKPLDLLQLSAELNQLIVTRRR